jgi:Rv0078B-related antitoxin
MGRGSFGTLPGGFLVANTVRPRCPTRGNHLISWLRQVGCAAACRMAPTDPTTPSLDNAFRTTLDLFETGLGLVRQNLRRDHPDATDQEIERQLHQWLQEPPGAEFGDCPIDLLFASSGMSLPTPSRLSCCLASRWGSPGRDI